MNLTSKQETFCQEIVKGKTQYESYCIAYPNQVETSERSTLDSNAYTLMQNTEIVDRIKELREPIAKAFNKSIGDLLREIDSIKLNSIDNNDKLALECLKEQGKLLGYYVDKKDIKTDGSMSPTIVINTNLKKQGE